MKNLTALNEYDLTSNLDKPIAVCIMLLGVAAVALVVALGFYFGIGAVAAGVGGVCLLAACGCGLWVRRRVRLARKVYRAKLEDMTEEERAATLAIDEMAHNFR